MSTSRATLWIVIVLAIYVSFVFGMSVLGWYFDVHPARYHRHEAGRP